MSIYRRSSVFRLFCFVVLAGIAVQASAAETGKRIAVLPVADNAPPSLQAARVAAGQVESLLSRMGGLDMVESATVRSAVRDAQQQSGVSDIPWQDVARALELDLVALLSLDETRVTYLGTQESATTNGNRHYYEGKSTVRLNVIRAEDGTTLLDERVTAKKTQGYDEPYDDSKYADIVQAVRDLASIFQDEDSGGGTTLTEDYASLAMSALKRAVDKLEAPLRDAFPLRGTIILIEGSSLTVDIGSDSGVRTGMRFDVVQPGRAITHPTTGEKMTTGGEVIGKAKVIRVSAGTAVLKAPRKVASAAAVGHAVSGGR